MAQSQTVRYKKGKHSFEILTKQGSVRQFLTGKLGWDKVLSADVIFTNSKKGDIAKKQDLITVFGTDDVNKCAEIMVRQGDAQVSASERKEDISVHRRQILEYLHKTYTDQAGLPHPLVRLETILEEAKIRIDPAVSVHKHCEDVIKRMIGKIVFKRNASDYTITVPKEHVKTCRDVVCKYCPVGRKEIREAGSTTWKVSITSSDFDNFLLEMNKITGGDFTVKSEN
jgi:rRNA metabolism SBDS family protein